MLVVLFVVVLVQERQQARLLRRLEDRVEGLENSRALERTTALEQQLRAMVERLRTLERSEDGLGDLENRQRELQREIDALRRDEGRRAAPEPSSTPGGEDLGPATPPPPPQQSGLPSGPGDASP
jgi:TolA-binding protein